MVHRPPGLGSLGVSLAGISLRSPVLLAAGTCGTLDEMADVLDLSRVGGLVTKSITRQPRAGNATWRILPQATGMLNAIGLANVGIDRFMAEYAPRVEAVPCAVIASVAGFSIEDYVAVAREVAGIPGIAGVELNVSCPNVHGGVEFGVDPGALRELVSAARGAVAHRTLMVKLSPIAVGMVSIQDVARAAIEGSGPGRGADVLCASNTIPAMAIDVRSRRPVLANRTGGLSGPALHPVALKLVHDLRRGVAGEAGVPIVGIGGVMRWEHAAAFILAGASAVQIGTGLFADPSIPLRVTRGLASWVRRQGCATIAELCGALREPEAITDDAQS